MKTCIGGIGKRKSFELQETKTSIRNERNSCRCILGIELELACNES